MMKFTPKKIEALEPRKKRFSVAVGDGLTLRVNPSGTKTWLVRIYQDGRTVDTTIGHFPNVSLRAAKQKSRTLRKQCGLRAPKGYTLEDAFRIWCRLKKGSIVSYKDERRRQVAPVYQNLIHARSRNDDG